jgi:hypothetical protein
LVPPRPSAPAWAFQSGATKSVPPGCVRPSLFCPVPAARRAGRRALVRDGEGWNLSAPIPMATGCTAPGKA